MHAPPKRPSFALKLAALSATAAVTLLCMEGVLHIAAWASPQAAAVLFPGREQPSSPDAELIMKGNPRFLEHDAAGFRNRSVPERADVVAIGDSHTYGTSVLREDAWPHELAALTSCSVYNMSLGGYGPLEYARLAERAMRMRPRVVFVGIYFGNDLFDNWQMYLAHPGAYALPGPLKDEAMAAELKAPLGRDVETFFTMGQESEQESAAVETWSLRGLLSRRSSSWGFARAVKRRLAPPPTDDLLGNDFDTAVAALTPQQLEYASVFEGGGWRTIFTARYREAVANDVDPRLKAGYLLTEWAVQEIVATATKGGAQPVFVLLPAKESVFFPKLARAEDHPYLERLVAGEQSHRTALAAYLDAQGVRYVDMLTPLRASSAQPYFENADGHPNPLGHDVIAAELARYAQCG